MRYISTLESLEFPCNTAKNPKEVTVGAMRRKIQAAGDSDPPFLLAVILKARDRPHRVTWNTQRERRTIRQTLWDRHDPRARIDTRPDDTEPSSRTRALARRHTPAATQRETIKINSDNVLAEGPQMQSAVTLDAAGKPIFWDSVCVRWCLCRSTRPLVLIISWLWREESPWKTNKPIYNKENWIWCSLCHHFIQGNNINKKFFFNNVCFPIFIL